MNPLTELQKYGQSVWLDYLRRKLITGGELERLVREDGVRGVTHNPNIFRMAIAGSSDYDEALREIISQEPHLSPRAIYEELAVQDVRLAAGVLNSVYDQTHGDDGYVSLGLRPEFAHDSRGSIDEARRLWEKINRPNVMIEVPATPAGIPAIEALIAEGINVNMTSIFSLEHYEAGSLAYFKGLEKCRSIQGVASVASFPVSRVDMGMDRALEAVTTPAALSLRGKIAVSCAKVAYKKFRKIFFGERWKSLEKGGARVPRILWASTGMKNPAYSDVFYVEELIGPGTITALSPATLNVFKDQGKVRASLEEGFEQAETALESLSDLRVNLKAFAQMLQDEELTASAGSYQNLLNAVEDKRRALLEGEQVSQTLHLAGYQTRLEERLASWKKMNFSRRLWARDPSIWSPRPVPEISNRLGWLGLPGLQYEKLDELHAFAQEVKAEGFMHLVLLGMGGSSLAPEVFQKTFGNRPGFPELRVLDSTHPACVDALEKNLDLRGTLFLVSSKSGTTLETLSFFRYFWDKVGRLTTTPGRRFIAITDPGSPLEKLARERLFRRTFLSHPEVGGRYSALTEFGLVPAALIGLDIHRLLDCAWIAAENNAFCVPENEATGLVLGAALGELAGERNKLTILTSSSLESFSVWLEQLIAESSGKEGKGIVPVANEPYASMDVFGRDRVFVSLILEEDQAGELEDRIRALEKVGYALIKIRLKDDFSLGREIYRWEIAVAGAGSVLGINPFNQPDVELAKKLARQAITGGKKAGKRTVHTEDAVPIDDPQGLAQAFKNWLSQARPGDYIALQAYLPPTADTFQLLQLLRLDLLKRTKLATTLGFGPRFLHSTGQLHKGGSDEGLFLQLIDEPRLDMEIPETDYSFGTLIQAQALGDYRALQQKGRRVLRVNLKDKISDGVEYIRGLV